MAEPQNKNRNPARAQVSDINFATRAEDGTVRTVDADGAPKTPDQLAAAAAVEARVPGAELSLAERVKLNNAGYTRLLQDEKSAFASAALYVPPAPPVPNLASPEEAKATDQKFFRVIKGGEVRLPGQQYTLRLGKICPANLYPIPELKKQGIGLEEITAEEAGFR